MRFDEADRHWASLDEAEAPLVCASPYLGRDPHSIPPRPWIMGRWLLRKTITAVVAPGGLGKSKFIASTALSLSTGRALLGKQVWKRPQRAWVWNLEDDGDELAREIEGAAIRHDVTPAEYEGRLFVDSGLDGARLCTAVERDGECKIMRPVIEALTDELRARSIDVLFVDPFVSSHQVDENHNGAIDAVAKEWARVAAKANCSIVLSHHTKKPGAQKITAEMSRGASALINAARIAVVLNRMDTDEANRFGIDGDSERRRYFTVFDDKHNRSPAEEADWFRLDSVDLGNIDPDTGHSDSVGVVAPWSPPDAFAGITADHLYRVQLRIAEGVWRENFQCGDWAGVAVADVLGLDAKADRARILSLLRTWVDAGALRIGTISIDRKARKTIEVGVWAER